MKIKDNNGSAKVIILVIAACITIGCIIFGTFRFVKNMGDSIDGGEISMEGSTAKTITETIDSIHVDAELGDIVIKAGDETSVEYKYSNSSMNPTCKIQNGELRVEQSGSSKRMFHFISCIGPGNTGASGQIIITVPKDTQLSTVRIDTGLGKIEITDIVAREMNVDSGLGNINITNCKVSKKIDADIALGDIRFTDVEADEIDVDQDCGDVNAGNITVNKMRVDNSLGDIVLDGALSDLNADDSLGDIEITNSLPDSDCKIKLDTSLGSVRYNGNKYGDEFSIN